MFISGGKIEEKKTIFFSIWGVRVFSYYLVLLIARIYSHDRFFSKEKNKDNMLLDELVTVPTLKHVHNIYYRR
jgi:hypothetical protein